MMVEAAQKMIYLEATGKKCLKKLLFILNMKYVLFLLHVAFIVYTSKLNLKKKSLKHKRNNSNIQTYAVSWSYSAQN